MQISCGISLDADMPDRNRYVGDLHPLWVSVCYITPPTGTIPVSYTHLDVYKRQTWYEWSIANWGTKWNALNQNFEEPNVLWFDTAWEGVPLLILTLSRNFRTSSFNMPMRMKTLVLTWVKGLSEMEKPT